MPRRFPAAITRFASFALVAVLSSVAGAQVRPDIEWRTLDSPHFRIHFNPWTSDLAARSARNAEIAYGRLSAVLVPPRGIVDIVVADNVDYANGYATVFPSNRIVIYARPPMEELQLRNHDDWNLALLTHELTHIFHLDRTKGWWGYAQRIFGRAAPLFPNIYSPGWITEGLAVQMESRFSPGGRMNGSAFPAYVRAAALEGELPTLDAASLAAPHFPGPNSAYLYGAYAMDHRGAREARSFVERSSERLIPWQHDGNAKSAFGESFSMQWARWRDSVFRAVAEGEVIDAARERNENPSVKLTVLADDGFTARFPRFRSDSTLLYLSSDSRVSTGLYEVSLAPGAKRHRVARRSGIDAPAWLPDGSLIQAELDFLDPYTVRSDLTRDAGSFLSAFRPRRLTRGQRLSGPDVHAASGRMLAVRTEPGTTSIVEVSPDDAFDPKSIAKGTLDLAWTDARWSRNGEMIAAAKWERGGRSSIIVMDTRGAVKQAFAPAGERYTVVSAPAWEPGDTTLLFVSDHEGRAMIYRGDVRTGAYGRVWYTATALNTPDVSPDGRRVAAVELRAKGWRVVMRDSPGPVRMTLPAADTAADRRDRPVTGEPPSDADQAIAESVRRGELGSPFKAGQGLRPSWWLPEISETGIGTVSIGARSSARDVIGRQAWAGSIAYEFENAEQSIDAVYSNAMLGNPVLGVQASTLYDHATIYTTSGTVAGYLARMTARFGATAVLQRNRARWGGYLLGGAEIEQAQYRTYPAALLLIIGIPPRDPAQTSTILAAGFSTMQQPYLALGGSDGIEVDLQHRSLFDVGATYADFPETIVSGTIAKSIPLPGFSRHLFTVHGAYAVTGHAATSGFSAGGLSGSSLEVLPGLVIGSSRRTFGVRGFDPGAQVGVRAAAANFEYRAPLTLIGRGLGLLPLFFQKASVVGFADVGAAWCSFEVTDSFLCPTANPERVWMQSVGAELALDASIHYDSIYRFRFGVAHPTRGLGFAAKSNTVYFSLGAAF